MLKIILASTSPQRKKLFKQLGLPFITRASDFKENLSLKIAPHKMAHQFSLGKAMSVAINEKNAIIIGADTIVACKNQILGKPKTSARAKKMLKTISGKIVSIITGYTIINTKTKKIITRSVETKAQIKKLTAKEISDYVKTGEPLDKAGAFAIQGRGAVIVKKINGDYNNVIGLPLFSLAESLKKM
ncbi:septum formation protein Maf [Patescibacteria group bacterium]|nr:septum formation protein Maf [Patescibacteria group bacterium]MBU0963527.1 septum formation protein Maf [Patescibacteria group bacterium]